MHPLRPSPLRLKRKIRRILVLNRNHIGDCLLTTPMLRALKRRFPEARVAVSIPVQNQELLLENPHVDEIVVRPEIRSWAAKIRFAVEMRRRRDDLIISLQEKSKFYAWATRYTTLLNPHAPITLALDHRRTRRAYQFVSPVRSDQHEVYKYLNLATLLGCPEEPNPVLELAPPPAAVRRVAAFLEAEGYDPETAFLGINPGGTKKEKRWPVERFAETADRLHRELGLPVVIFGGPEDRRRAAAIQAQMTTTRPLVAAGRLSLGETAALLERCRLLVTGDTGPMHMAVALAVPVVALFGPTSPVKFGPFTSHKVVLRHAQPCPQCSRPCLHTIATEECVEAALKLHAALAVMQVGIDHSQA